MALAGDPGGAEAVAPVILKLLEDDRYKIHVFSYLQATDVFCKRGLSTNHLVERISHSELKNLFDSSNTGLALCATSVNGFDLEKALIAISNTSAIPSISVVDHWTNYQDRFVLPETGHLELPTKITVPIHEAKREMIEAGFCSELISVCGHPALDRLSNINRDSIERIRSQVREKIGVAEQDTVVVFASQPLIDFHGGEKRCVQKIGYTEESVFNLLANSMDKIYSEQRESRLILVVKTHPREFENKWSNLANDSTILLNPTEDSTFHTCLAADAVVGMSSMLLVEAAIAGCRVISVEPNARNSIFPKELGISSLLVEDHHLLAFDIQNLLERGKPASNPRFIPNSTSRVVKEIEMLLTNNSSIRN